VPVIGVADKDTSGIVVAGITVEDITASTTGIIQAQGTLAESWVNTSGMTAGDKMYLGDDGTFTDVKPTTGNVVIVGAVGVVAPSSGTILLDCPAYPVVLNNDPRLTDNSFINALLFGG
jgi:hypothetical protein